MSIVTTVNLQQSKHYKYKHAKSTENMLQGVKTSTVFKILISKRLWICIRDISNIQMLHKFTESNGFYGMSHFSLAVIALISKWLSSAVAEKPWDCCKGQFWPKVEEDILQTLWDYLQPLWRNQLPKLSNLVK